MKLNSPKYTFSHLIIGAIILYMGVIWEIRNIDSFLFWNSFEGRICGNVIESNRVIFIEMALGITSIVLSIFVLENKLKPKFGGLSQLLIMFIGFVVLIGRPW